MLTVKLTHNELMSFFTESEYVTRRRAREKPAWFEGCFCQREHPNICISRGEEEAGHEEELGERSDTHRTNKNV